MKQLCNPKDMNSNSACARPRQHLPPLLSLSLFLSIFSSCFLVVLTTSEWEFSYDESSPLGPQHWGDLLPEWSTCKHGREQSPVDVNSFPVYDPPTQPLDVFYRWKPAFLQNKGHDIMVNWTNGGGCFLIGGEEYVLRQSHWHSPAEHTIFGLRYPLEMHTVFTTSTGKIAVIGVVYKLGYEEDRFISKLVRPLKHLIETQEKEIDIGVVHPDDIERDSSYFRYHGSLTTPPCTQGVIWTLMEEVKTVSPGQLNLLREAVHNMSNARPVQPINERKIKVFKQRHLKMVLES